MKIIIVVIVILSFITVTNAVVCSEVEKLPVPSINKYTTSKQLAFTNENIPLLSLDVCVNDTNIPIHVIVYDYCINDTFTDSLLSFETQASCNESLPLEIPPNKDHIFYLDITVTKEVEYQIEISPITSTTSENNSVNMQTYAPYIIVGVCLISVGIVSIILAIVASRKHKKDEQAQYQDI